MTQASKFLMRQQRSVERQIKFVTYPYGSEHYLKTKEILPDHAIEELKDLDAIYFGAVGDPRVEPGVMEINLILRIRFV